MDDWNIVYEKVEPHGLCCEKCKQSRVLLADAKDALAAMLVEIPDVRERDATQFAGLNAYLSEEERAAIRALLARIEELEGKA